MGVEGKYMVTMVQVSDIQPWDSRRKIFVNIECLESLANT